MEAVQPLALPVLSMMHRKGDSLEPACGKAFSFLTVVIWPFYAFMALFAEPIVVVLFGPQWRDSHVLLRLLAIASMAQLSQPLAEPLLIAIGRIDLKYTGAGNQPSQHGDRFAGRLATWRGRRGRCLDRPQAPAFGKLDVLSVEGR